MKNNTIINIFLCSKKKYNLFIFLIYMMHVNINFFLNINHKKCSNFLLSKFVRKNQTNKKYFFNEIQ